MEHSRPARNRYDKGADERQRHDKGRVLPRLDLLVYILLVVLIYDLIPANKRSSTSSSTE